MKIEFTGLCVDDVQDLYSVSDSDNVQSNWPSDWTKIVGLEQSDTWQSDSSVTTIGHWIENVMEPDGKWGVYAYMNEVPLIFDSIKPKRNNRGGRTTRPACSIVIGFEDPDDALRFKLMGGSNIEDFQDVPDDTY